MGQGWMVKAIWRCERGRLCEMTAFPRGPKNDLGGCDHGAPPQDVWHRLWSLDPPLQTSGFCNWPLCETRVSRVVICHARLAACFTRDLRGKSGKPAPPRRSVALFLPFRGILLPKKPQFKSKCMPDDCSGQISVRCHLFSPDFDGWRPATDTLRHRQAV